jgi:hypothetical protein
MLAAVRYAYMTTFSALVFAVTGMEGSRKDFSLLAPEEDATSVYFTRHAHAVRAP